MHSRVFEIECKRGMTEGLEYDLPEWWTGMYTDWYSEETEEDSKESIKWLKEEAEVRGQRIDFSVDKGGRLKKAYEKAKELALQFASMTFDDFKEYKGLDLAHYIASAVEDKYHFWFYNPTEGEEICTLDEMLHRGGKYYLTGRTWDYHY